jgi:hypothetical protein
VSHHSLMRRACGDAIIIGGSTLHHIKEVGASMVPLDPLTDVFPCRRTSSISRRDPCVS